MLTWSSTPSCLSGARDPLELVRVSVVVPVYNSAKSLEELVQRTEQVFASSPLFDLAEMILVDDSSADDSWAVVSQLCASRDWICGVALARNFGQHSAILAGLAECTGDVIVTMDDDLQHLPEEIPTLLGALEPSVDVVYGRAREEEHGFWRNASSRSAKWATAVAAGSQVAQWVSGFRAFRAWMVPGVRSQHGPFVSVDVALSWLSDRIRPVQVRMDKRRYGQSNYTFRRLVHHALNMLFGYSTVPLRLAAYLGAAVAAVGGGLFIYVCIRFLIGDSAVPGFTFLAAAITLFAGIQLLALGVLSEYVARLYANSIGRPQASVREAIDRRGGGRGVE